MYCTRTERGGFVGIGDAMNGRLAQSDAGGEHLFADGYTTWVLAWLLCSH